MFRLWFSIFRLLVFPVFETGAEVPIHRLQLDEDQRQAVNEADKIRAAIVVRNPLALDFQLADGQKAIVVDVEEIDNFRTRMPRLAREVAPLHRNAVADESIVFAVVLEEGAREVNSGEFLDGLLKR